MSRMAITRQSLLTSADYIKLGDVYYFGSLDHWSKQAFESLNFSWQPWMQDVFGYHELPGILKEAGNLLLFSNIQNRYSIFRDKHKTEPVWVEFLPPHNRQYLRYSYLQMGEDLESLAIFPSLPYSGFGYHVVEGGITERIIQAFGLYRLKGIKQLGYLHHPTIHQDGASTAVQGFSHHRFQHVMDVRAVAKLILANNNRSGAEMVLSDIATLTHDTLTPAGGDSIKWIDQKLFDEDLHYPELMSQVDWRNFPEAPADAPQVLPQIILNRGVLGQVLDIADKVAYVGGDLAAFYEYGPPGSEGRSQIAQLLKQEPQPSSIWECVQIEQDQMYFTDKARLIKFLTLRAMLFSHLYSNPASRFWEMFVKTFTQKRLYETGKVTRQDLLRMQDSDLNHLIWTEAGQDMMGTFIGLNEERMETFSTQEQAKQRTQELIASGRSVILPGKKFVAKAGVHFSIQTKDGIKPLSDADPESTELIRNTIRPNYEYSLHYLDIHQRDLPEVLAKWQEWCN